MKRRFHTTLSVVSALTLSIGSLAVIGSTTLAQTIPTRGAAETPVVSRATTNLSWFSDFPTWPVTGWTADTSSPVYKTITDKFGLTFTTDVPPEDSDAKLSLMLTTGDIPDVISLQDATEVSLLVQSGRVWNLTQFFKKYDPSFLKEAYPNGLGAQAISQQKANFGGFYGIPNYDSAPDMFTGKIASVKAQDLYESNDQVVLNVPLMKKAGITLADVKTAAGFQAALEKVASMHLKVNGQPVVPLQVDTSTAWQANTLNSIAQMFGAMPVTKSGNYRPLRLSPEMKTTIDYLHSLASKGVITPDEFTLDQEGVDGVVNAGRAFAFVGDAGSPNWGQMYDNNHSETIVSPGNILSPNNLTPTWGYSYNTDWTYTLISKTAPDPAAIAKWLAYMWSPPGQLLINYGIKGPDWNWGANGRVVPNKKVDSIPEKKTGISQIWFFTDYPYLLTVEPNVNKMPGTEYFKMELARATTSPVHLYNSSALSMPATLIPAGSTLSNDQAQINQYWQEQVLKMIFSSSAAQENALYRQTISEMQRMGLTQIDQVYNKQFHKQERMDHYTLKGINP